MLLKGTKVFLTGGSRGIGKAAVFELVKQGADVAFTYVNSEKGAIDTVDQAKKINPDVTMRYYQLDVRNSKQVNEVAEKLLLIWVLLMLL